MAATAKPLILVTGANGTIGYAILTEALAAGYLVRAAVRGSAGAEKISNGPSAVPFLADGSLTFVIVPDIVVPGAYMDAARGCEYIIHCASPLPGIPGDLATPALNGCKNILEAAEAHDTVKRVVITASMCSVRPFAKMFASHPDNMKIAAGDSDGVALTTGTTRVDAPLDVSNSAPNFERYTQSKTLSANYVRDFISTQKPRFSVVQLMAGYVLGPSELARSRMAGIETGNVVLAWMWFPFKMGGALGLPSDANAPLVAETVSLRDVVEAHLKALDTDKVPGKLLEYVMCSDGPHGPVFADAVDIVRKRLPETVESGRVPLDQEVPGTIRDWFDASAVEREVLERPLQSFEEMTVETVQWLADLPLSDPE